MQLTINGIQIQIDGDNISITTPNGSATATGRAGYVSNTIDPPNFAYGHVARQIRSALANNNKSFVVEAHCRQTVYSTMAKERSTNSFYVNYIDGEPYKFQVEMN